MTKIISVVLWLLFGCSPYLLGNHQLISVNHTNGILYSEPSKDSPVVRRLFEGEVIMLVSIVDSTDFAKWGKIKLSDKNYAFIPMEHVQHGTNIAAEIWETPIVLRNERPMSFAFKGPAEIFGVALQMRYLPFARLGLALNTGSVLYEGSMKGTSISAGIVSMLSLDDFSPFVDFGVGKISYHDNNSIFRMTTFYLSSGFEWIFSSGYFFSFGVTYNRSMDIEISYEYDFAKSNENKLKVGKYGPFTEIENSGSFQKVNPLISLGYSY